MEEAELMVNEYRLDGRKANQIRDMKIKTNIVENCTGSCMIESFGTKILVWIKGPREGRSKSYENNGSLKVDFTISQSAYPYLKPDLKRNLQMREFSSTLKEIFEEVVILKHYSRSEIEINVAVLQNDGSYKSLAITAVTLALISAGIYIKDTAIGMSIGLYKEDYLVDLTKKEERGKIPIINCCYLPNTKKVVYMEVSNSTVEYQKSENFIKSVDGYSDMIYSIIKNYLLNNFQPNDSEEMININQGGILNDNNMMIEDDE